MNELKVYFEKNKEQILQDFIKFLSFESVSTDPVYHPKVIDCANWLSNEIKKLGFSVEQWKTPGYPVIFASQMQAGSKKPTLLIYNHYDVQPVDPENAWNTPPFQPTIREGEVYARGAQDNKGQCFYTLLALKYLTEKGNLPINIKWIIEGEEESGSYGLGEILKDKKIQQQLKADHFAIVDMGIHDLESPAITLGVRGLVTMEVRVQTSKGDLHSGSHGGIVYNPIQALVEILSKLHTSDGKVNIPHFYDAVQDLKPEEKREISFDFDTKKYEELFEAKPLGGEKAYSPLERAWVRPTLEINGISGGYGGSGFKTVLPAKALAKVSCRLVPDQDPDKIGKLVSEHLKKLAPKGVNVAVEIYHGGGMACRANPHSEVANAFSKAYEDLFQIPCKKILDGGTIPIATKLKELSGAELVLVGFGLPDDNIHAPNEHFGINRLEKGFCMMIRAIENLSRV